MSSPSSDSSDTDQGTTPLRSLSLSINARRVTRNFVLLKEKLRSVPRVTTWDVLNRRGRVKEISFPITLNGNQFGEKIRSEMAPLLDGADLTK